MYDHLLSSMPVIFPEHINIPLFDDNEREAVGSKYKKEGRSKAILEGLELTGPSMSSKLEEALKLAKDDKLLVHCWRGGMRSEAMAWLFSLGDIDTEILDGGYKSYRHYVLEKLRRKTKLYYSWRTDRKRKNRDPEIYEKPGSSGN